MLAWTSNALKRPVWCPVVHVLFHPAQTWLSGAYMTIKSRRRQRWNIHPCLVYTYKLSSRCKCPSMCGKRHFFFLKNTSHSLFLDEHHLRHPGCGCALGVGTSPNYQPVGSALQSKSDWSKIHSSLPLQTLYIQSIVITSKIESVDLSIGIVFINVDVMKLVYQ